MRRFLTIVGGLLLLPVLLLLGLGLAGPISGWGIAYLVALLVITVGMLTATTRVRQFRGVTRFGVVALLAVVTVHGFMAHRALRDSPLSLLTLPQGTSRFVDVLIPERDLAVAGARLLELKGAAPVDLVPKLRAAYQRFHSATGPLPTPLAATYLGQQRPDAFDTFIVRPDPASKPKGESAVVFLHGYAGNVSMICWLFAQSFASLDVTTVCPSTGFKGQWWQEDGKRTVLGTLRYLRENGFRRVFLAGLSNGAYGASELAADLAVQLDGVVLISGVSPDARPVKVPALLIRGRYDRAVSAAAAARYLKLAGPFGQEITLGGDHYVLVTREAEVRSELVRWMKARLTAPLVERGTIPQTSPL